MKFRLSMTEVLRAAAVLLISTGCARFDPVRARRDQTETFSEHLARQAEVELARPLSLEDCIRIAVTNNYEARQADLTRELYRIGKNTAFTAFLPNAAVSAGYRTYAKDPQIASREYGNASLEITMPIVMPSTWFLYAAARQGYASAKIASAYVRQGIVLQTTVNYFNLLVQQDTIAALESQLEAARQMAERVQGLTGEGFIARWEGDQAQFVAESRETELEQARRHLAVVRADLLQGMGLAPNAPLTISGEAGQANMPTGSVEHLVIQALEVHPELSLADRAVVIQEHGVRQAFCSFIPVLSIFSTGTWTSDEIAKHSANWVSGLQGAWLFFDGLANVARYRAAKVERRRSELARESTFLSIMAQVIAAEAVVRDASAAAHLRQRAYEVAKAKYEDYAARAEEGLLPLSDALDARGAMDLHQVAAVRSRYQERIAVANLELAMGLTLVPEPSRSEP